MPFITQERRKAIRDLGSGEAQVVGDLCFIVYSEMIRRWKENPRWTTIHYIKREFVIDVEHCLFLKQLCKCLNENRRYLLFTWIDLVTASALAFDVFMNFYGFPYEREKEKLNGTIE